MYNLPGAQCCVFECGARIKFHNASNFYKFPRKDELVNGESLLWRWINAVKITKKFPRNSIVCHRHFKDEDFIDKDGRRELKPGTVPSQLLPRVWRNKFYPREYGKLVKFTEVRGIGRLRLCFEAKLERRFRKSHADKSKSWSKNRLIKKKTEKTASTVKNDGADEVVLVSNEGGGNTGESTVPQPLPKPLLAPNPFTSELDIKEEPFSDQEGTIEDMLARMNDEPVVQKEKTSKDDATTPKTAITSTSCSKCSSQVCKCQDQTGGTIGSSRSVEALKEQGGNQTKKLSKSQGLSCHICMIGFPRSDLLMEHNKLLHSKAMASYVCMLCNDSFKSKIGLMEHVATHAVINSFKCKVCSKCFISKKDLDDHFKGHKIVKREYMCRECKMTLKTRAACWDHLNLHIRGRIKAGGIPCKICGRILSTRATLKEHMHIHSGEKPYECLLCGKKIRHRTNFLLHVEGHTLGLPHQCKTCGMSFNKKSELNLHISQDHPEEKSYSCIICGLKFKTESRFLKHAVSHDAHLLDD